MSTLIANSLGCFFRQHLRNLVIPGVKALMKHGFQFLGYRCSLKHFVHLLVTFFSIVVFRRLISIVFKSTLLSVSPIFLVFGELCAASSATVLIFVLDLSLIIENYYGILETLPNLRHDQRNLDVFLLRCL